MATGTDHPAEGGSPRVGIAMRSVMPLSLAMSESGFLHNWNFPIDGADLTFRPELGPVGPLRAHVNGRTRSRRWRKG
jgi:hypothetical protein